MSPPTHDAVTLWTSLTVMFPHACVVYRVQSTISVRCDILDTTDRMLKKPGGVMHLASVGLHSLNQVVR